MASFFSSVRQGFIKNKGNQPGRGNGQGTPSPTTPNYSPSSSLPPSVPPMPHSPALSSSMSFESQGVQEPQAPSSSRRPPFFFREEYSSLIVRGNFMTLAAKPKLVDEGEWLAHQVVEQYRLLEQMIEIIKVVDERTGRPICNPDVCPTMSASGHTYTWLDNNKKPIKIPAIQYINLVQKWILGKINDTSIFPTDTSSAVVATNYASGSLTPSSTPQPLGPTNLNAPLSQLAGREWLGKSSGFPENFEGDIKSIYRQMMRCYAHIYHGHWLDPFWNVNSYKELNTCFIHFINVGKLFNLLGDKEVEPMQPLIDLWFAKGLLPPPTAPVQGQENSPAPHQSQAGIAS
ncbi:protein kinase-like protein activator [Dendryphion nanum]|uniref:Protein kinase-like protein activator n=1 Tax=Dendryphion nanum TaxID=256645 RepID=A0A9P9E4P1_9PLEO|nr:protein kinase-like protein activator [Dendryphion nanum]